MLTSSPYQLLYLMSDIEYKEFDRLMSPQQVIQTMSGSCHDQVLFEMQELTEQGLEPKAKFIMAVDKDGIGGETHSFVYYADAPGIFWFENAWEDYRGINDFITEDEMLNFIIDAFINRNPGQFIYLGAFIPEDHTVGEDLQTLVDICMENAVQV